MRCIFLIVVLLFKLSALGQGAFFTSGTDFLIPFLGSFQSRNYIFSDTSTSSLSIVAYQSTCVEVSVTNTTFRFETNLEKDSAIVVNIPISKVNLDTGDINRHSILVKSKNPISVIYYNGVGINDTAKHRYSNRSIQKNMISQDIAAVSPSGRASSYYLMNIANDSNSVSIEKFHRYWILSTHSQPVEIIHYSFSLRDTKPIGLPFTVNLDADTYYADGINGGGLFIPPLPFSNNLGYTGNRYSANIPNSLLLFTGGAATPYSTCVSDGITQITASQSWENFEQSKPVSYADTNFLATQLAHSYTNLYNILATEDSTAIYANGIWLKTINKGIQLDTCLTGLVAIKTSRPSLVTLSRVAALSQRAQDTLNWVSSSEYSAFTITMPSTNELIKRSVIYAFEENFNNSHFVALFTKTTDTNLVQHNGNVLLTGSWQVFASNPAYSIAQIEIGKGYNNFTSSGSGFNGYYYSLMKKTQGYHFMPSRGTALIEASSWPEDSILHHIGPDTSNLQTFSNYTSLICVGQSLLVQPSHARYTTWQISWDNGQDTSLYATSNPAAGATLTFLTIGQFWLTIKDSAGCSAPDSVLITILPNPQAQFTAQTQAACLGTFVQLQNQSTGASNYNWQWPGGSSTAANPEFLYTGTDNSLTITLVATAGICTSSITQTITLSNQTFDASKIPNVFSPNNDGVNDAFCIPETQGFIDCYQLEIFNRWGSPVFATKNPEVCWQAEDAAAGVYFYVLNIGQQIYNGQVTVFK